MASPRRKKALADLKSSPTRTILVVLSIAIGVFAVGSMLTTRVVLQRGVDESFELANPASAVLITEPFGSELVEATEALPEISDAEGRARIETWLLTGDDTRVPLDLYAIPDFEIMQVDRVLPESGAWPPAEGEVLIERLSKTGTGTDIGRDLMIEMPGGDQHLLRMAGLAYDPGQIDPSFNDDRLSGYITLETLEILGQTAAFNEMHIRATSNPADIPQGEYVAGLTRDNIFEPNGVTVHRIAVHDTPRYQSEDLLSVMVLILALMGGLVLLLGAFIIVNTINALTAQQVRQIGIMKAVGGQRRQITVLYLATVLGYSVMAVALAVPTAALAARGISRFFADMLNINVVGPWFPPSVVALELGLGLLVPLMAALVPVMRGTGVTVQEALTSYGVSSGLPSSQSGLLGRTVERLPGVSRPTMMSLRNPFRRRGRMVLTLATLTLGGALLASVATISSSLDNTLEGVMQYSSYDVEVNLQEPQPKSLVVNEVASLSNVEHAEGWIATNGSRIRPDGSQNSNIWLHAVPADTHLITPTLLDGRWLQPNEGEAVVVNVDFRSDESDVGIGDLVTLQVEGQELQWPVVGVVTTQFVGPVVFVPYDEFSRAVGMPGETNHIVLVTDPHDVATQEEVAQLAEDLYSASGVPVSGVNIQSDLRQGTESVFNILVMLLVFIGVMLAIVSSAWTDGDTLSRCH